MKKTKNKKEQKTNLLFETKTLRKSFLLYLYTIPNSIISAFIVSGTVLVWLYPFLWLTESMDVDYLVIAFCNYLPLFTHPDSLFGYAFAISKWLLPILTAIYFILYGLKLLSPIKKPLISQFECKQPNITSIQSKHFNNSYTFAELLKLFKEQIKELQRLTNEYLANENSILKEKEKFEKVQKTYQNALLFYEKGNPKIWFRAVKENFYLFLGATGSVLFAIIWAIIGSLITAILYGIFTLLANLTSFFELFVMIIGTIGPILSFGIPVLGGIILILTIPICVYTEFDNLTNIKYLATQLKNSKKQYENAKETLLKAQICHDDFKFLSTKYQGCIFANLTCFDDMLNWNEWLQKWKMSLAAPDRAFSKARELEFFFEASEYATNMKDIEKYLKVCNNMECDKYERDKIAREKAELQQHLCQRNELLEEQNRLLAEQQYTVQSLEQNQQRLLDEERRRNQNLEKIHDTLKHIE